MRIVAVSALLGAFLAGCTTVDDVDAAAACQAQGHAPGTEEYRVCMDADGARVATGPGSPYANADEEEGDL